MNGLYYNLVNEFSILDTEIFTKASMVAMSHSVEKVVKEYDLNADIYVLFQDYKYFLSEKERYLEFDQLCRQIFVMAHNIPEAAGEDFENTTFIEIEDDSPLLKEWSVTVDHPDFSAVLATREEVGLQKINKEDYRIFKGFLSLEKEVAADSIKYYQQLFKERGIDYIKEDWNQAELQNKKPKLQKLLSLFINDSLSELETKLRSLEEKEESLDKMLQNNKELSREVMQKLCEASGFRDEDSLFHIIRIGFTSALIYRELGAAEEEVEKIFFAALLHDLGKIGIPDSILQKPGKLNDEEYRIMKGHAEMGAKILAGSKSDVLKMAHNIAYSHHEKWDGSGYPQGLKGEEIPIEARIAALADVFDALSSDRVYKDAFSREKCVKIVSEERNRHFQSEILDILLANLDEVFEFREDLKMFSEGKTTREISDYFFSVKFSILDFIEMRNIIKV